MWKMKNTLKIHSLIYAVLLRIYLLNPLYLAVNVMILLVFLFFVD